MNYSISNAPELEWLKAKSINGTPEGADIDDKEFRRTWCSIELLEAVLNGDYAAFSDCQPEEVRITRKSFSEICSYVNSALKTVDDRIAMMAYLVINDLGKVEDFVAKINDTMNFESADHDKVLFEGLRAHPEFSPTFNALDAKYQELILNGLATCFNMGQFVQCENLPASLVPLTQIDKESLDFYMIHVLFDIAGAAGHVNSNGSLICNELYWKKFSWALEAIYKMTDNESGPVEAYNDYLIKTMEFFGVTSPVVGKLCNMIRVSSPEEAEQVRLAYDNLREPVRINLEKELAATGIGDDTAILMYYAPAMFQNALRYYRGKNPSDAIARTVKRMVPQMSGIYKSIRTFEEAFCGFKVVSIADLAKAALEPETPLWTIVIIHKGEDIVVERDKKMFGFSFKITSK